LYLDVVSMIPLLHHLDRWFWFGLFCLFRNIPAFCLPLLEAIGVRGLLYGGVSISTPPITPS
jgi:hypothetical protein